MGFNIYNEDDRFFYCIKLNKRNKGEKGAKKSANEKLRGRALLAKVGGGQGKSIYFLAGVS